MNSFTNNKEASVEKLKYRKFLISSDIHNNGYFSIHKTFLAMHVKLMSDVKNIAKYTQERKLNKFSRVMSAEPSWKVCKQESN
jgi:hypothetical protein